MMMFLCGHTEIEGRKEREHIRLNEGYQQFQETHKNPESDGNRCDNHTEVALYIRKDEYQTHESQDDDMSCGYVGEETNHEDEGFRENTHEFYDRHQRQRYFQPPRYPGGVENVVPVCFIAAETGYNEGNQRHDPGYGKVSGDIGTEREDGDESHQVIEEYKEEESKEIGQVSVSFMTDGSPGHVVTYKKDDRFQHGLQAFGSLARPSLISSGHRGKDQNNDSGADKDRKDIFRDGEIVDLPGIFIRFHRPFPDPDDLPFLRSRFLNLKS